MKTPSGYNLAVGFAVLCLLVSGSLFRWFNRAQQSPEPMDPLLLPYTPAALAGWPLPQTRDRRLSRGVTHWLARQSDGTTIDLVEFDFQANASLRFGLYDQDEDDARPFDNIVDYWPMGVGQATRKLNQKFASVEPKPTRIVAAWNGLFFGYYHKSKPGKRSGINEKAGHHVASVAIDGRVHYNTANHRWCFGVKYVHGKPIFKALHMPGRDIMMREFDYGGGSAQCLIQNGKPLRLQPFPRTRAEILKGPVASTPADAGHIPTFDHMRTCRTSMAWSADNRRFYLLLVKEPDTEAASAVAFRNGKPDPGGWTVADVQRFWLALQRARSIAGAVNIDAGGVAQMTLWRPDQKYDYDLVPGQEDSTAQRIKTTRDFSNAPCGGSIMYFYVRDTKSTA